jgi:WD40 repeat protein
VCAVGEYLAVASETHHSVHILREEYLDGSGLQELSREVAAILVGHLDWITCLLPSGSDHLFSASKDGSVRRWDLGNVCCDLQIDGGGSSVIDLSFGMCSGCEILFTAGIDKKIEIWDLTNKNNVDTYLFEGLPRYLQFVENKSTLYVALEAKTNSGGSGCETLFRELDFKTLVLMNEGGRPALNFRDSLREG